MRPRCFLSSSSVIGLPLLLEVLAGGSRIGLPLSSSAALDLRAGSSGISLPFGSHALVFLLFLISHTSEKAQTQAYFLIKPLRKSSIRIIYPPNTTQKLPRLLHFVNCSPVVFFRFDFAPACNKCKPLFLHLLPYAFYMSFKFCLAYFHIDRIKFLCILCNHIMPGNTQKIPFSHFLPLSPGSCPGS